MIGLDFADPERGLSGALRPSGAAVLFDHDAVLAASAEAGARIGDGDDAVANLELDGVEVDLEVSQVGAPLMLGGERVGSEQLAVCQVLGELRRQGEATPVACLGVRSQTLTDPDSDRLSLVRSIAVAFSDGGLLALRGVRPPGASGHGDEELSAALANADGEVVQAHEPLLSTQYDEAGRHVRATLELWREEGEEPRPPLRAAGSIVCGTSLAIGERRLDVAFFRWSMDGRPGLGRYEILSSPAGE